MFLIVSIYSSNDSLDTTVKYLINIDYFDRNVCVLYNKVITKLSYYSKIYRPSHATLSGSGVASTSKAVSFDGRSLNTNGNNLMLISSFMRILRFFENLLGKTLEMTAYAYFRLCDNKCQYLRQRIAL